MYVKSKVRKKEVRIATNFNFQDSLCCRLPSATPEPERTKSHVT